LAEYRQHYGEIRAANANVVAISVDPPEKSDSVRRELRLPFPILSDMERRVVQQRDVYNAHEKGGIAKPSVFILDRDRTVRYASVDGVASRVPATEIIRMLRDVSSKPIASRKFYFPPLGDWFRAIRGALRHGVRARRS
jgi:peroxiredoxin